MTCSYINNTKIIYEITSSKNYHALLYLTGKIIYLKKVIKDLKVIVILTNKEKLSTRKEDMSISKYSDVVLLKNQFNKENIIKARETILDNSRNLNSL